MSDVHPEFVRACAVGDVSRVRELLALTGDAYIDVHAGEEEALLEACDNGHVDVVRLLLSLTGDREMDADANEAAALYFACAGGHPGVMRLLLDLTGPRRVNVHWDNDNFLVVACAGGSVEAVRLLLSLKGDRALSLDTYGGAAVHYAHKYRHTAVMSLLVQTAWDRGRLHQMQIEEPRALCPLLRDPLQSAWLRRSGALLAAWCAGCAASSAAAEAARETRQLLREAHWAVRGVPIMARAVGRALRRKAGLGRPLISKLA